MSHKLKLLKTANKNIETDSGFFAHYLGKYSEIENVSETDIISMLNCTTENYYKLGLCKAPPVNSKDFVQRLNNISDYTGISVLTLNKIIKRVHSVLKISEINKHADTSYLMAARDKNKKDK